MSRIKRNAIQCKLCGVVIESKHRHDFVAHECTLAGKAGLEWVPAFPYMAVDGGLNYLRRIGNKEWMIELSEYEDE